MAVRGCGSGLPGKNDRGLDLFGLLAFIQLQQCAQDRCNAKLNLSARALTPAGGWQRPQAQRPPAGRPAVHLGSALGAGSQSGAELEAEPGSDQVGSRGLEPPQAEVCF